MKTRRNFIKSTLLASPVVVLPGLIPEIFNTDKYKILIIGDSISIGYTPFVKELLKYSAEIVRPVNIDGSDENCQGTIYGVANIDRWLGSTKWDVIHFNFGLHDIKHVDPVTGEGSNNPTHPLQAELKLYKKNLEIIVQKLKATGARLIFATTTPYPGSTNNPLRDPGMPVKYNREAIKIMNKNKIMINDLYAFMLPRLSELQLPQNVHFTAEGYNALAQKVVERIKEAIREESTKSEDRGQKQEDNKVRMNH
jgi:hypothetical protein